MLCISEIDHQILRIYSTDCKNEKDHINVSSETLLFQVINMFYIYKRLRIFETVTNRFITETTKNDFRPH